MRRNMIDDIKIVFFLIGMAILSAIVRFKTFAGFLVDAALGFAMGYSFYLLLGLWIEDGAVRSGVVGLVILCSRPLYDCAEKFIKDRLEQIIEKKIE